MAAEETTAIVRAGVEAWNNRDWETSISLISPTCELVNEATGETLTGHEGFRHFWDQWNTSFPDQRVRVTSLIVDNTGAAVEATFEGTHTGPLQTPGGDIPPTGKSVRTVYAAFFTIEDGKISSYRLYFDILTLLQQLCVAPQPAPAGA